MLGFLQRARRQGATILIADAQRPFAPHAGMNLLLRRTVPANRDLEGVAERDVRILSMR
jgi:predicted nicotinamide N-methyase